MWAGLKVKTGAGVEAGGIPEGDEREDPFGQLQNQLEQVHEVALRQEQLLLRVAAHLQLTELAAPAAEPLTSAGPPDKVGPLTSAGNVGSLPSAGRPKNVGPLPSAGTSVPPTGAAGEGQLEHMAMYDSEDGSASPWSSAECGVAQLTQSEFACSLFRESERSRNVHRNRNSVNVKPLLSRTSSDMDGGGAPLLDESLAGLQGSAWHPDSPSRMIYEGASTLILLYDAFYVPYLLSWGDDQGGGLWEMAGWCVRIFWTTDLFIGFTTGFWIKRLQLELRIRHAAMHYLRTFFALDVSLVLVDWISWRVPQMGALRAMRLVRAGRQTRRAIDVIFKLKAAFPKKGFSLLVDMGVIMVSIFWLAHVWCCIWYAIGLDTKRSDTETTWLHFLRGDDEPNPRYEYVTALHWSLTQITPGSMEVVPKSSLERCYNVGVLFVGLIIGTSLIATITAMITQYRIHLESSHKDFRMLEKYLAQCNANPGLTIAIKRQVRAKFTEKVRLKASEVRCLSWTANYLQEVLWCQFCVPRMELHPFWSTWGRMDINCLVSFCNAAMSNRSYAQGDLVFEVGRRSSDMYIVAVGELLYSPKSGGGESKRTSVETSGDGRHVVKDMWCVEAALWLEWYHAGTMKAAEPSELLSVNVQRWHAELSRFPEAIAVLAEYANVFLKHFQGDARSDLSTTLNYHELISDISHDARVRMSTPLFHQLENRRGVKSQNNAAMLNLFSDMHVRRIPHSKITKLHSEVCDGKADIGIVCGEVQRFIFVVALRILHPRSHQHSSQNLEAGHGAGVHNLSRASSSPGLAKENSRQLVKVAERLASGKVKVNVQLPGTKRRESESCEDAIDRVIHTDLKALAASLKWSNQRRREVDVFTKESDTVGIPTRYSRTIFQGRLANNVESLTMPVPEVDLVQEPTRMPTHFSSLWRCQRAHTEEDGNPQAEIVHVLQKVQEAIVIPEGGKAGSDGADAGASLYVWLWQHEMEALSQERSKPILLQWASAVCALEEFRARSQVLFAPQEVDGEGDAEDVVSLGFVSH